jgi:hypothetical protein
MKQESKESRRSVRKHVYWKSKRECVLLLKKQELKLPVRRPVKRRT